MSGTIFELLELTQTPTLPAPWSSTDPGETWVWGDFFFILQRNPVTMMESLSKAAGKRVPDMGLRYPYVMTAFYRIDRNPHGPSHRPVATATLEQSDENVALRNLGVKMILPRGRKWGPLFLCMFTPGGLPNFVFAPGSKFGGHQNYGEYEGGMDRETIRARFFAMLGQYLGLDGQPRMIGTIAQAHGHPETGLPAKSGRAGGGSGCAVLLMLGFIVAGLGLWALFGQPGHARSGEDERRPVPCDSCSAQISNVGFQFLGKE